MRAYKQKVKAYLRKAKPELIEKGLFEHVTFYVLHISLLSSKKKRLEVKLERKYCDISDLDNYFKSSHDVPKVFYIKRWSNCCDGLPKVVQYATTNRTRNYKFGGTCSG